MIRVKEVGPWVFTLDKLEAELYSKIQAGETVTSGGNSDIRNALTRLNRNELIINTGSRRHPNWVINKEYRHTRHMMILSRSHFCNNELGDQ